jgi:short-subunit dehydrogenase
MARLAASYQDTTNAAGSSKHVLITGASGGLGAALARAYANQGARLSLWGRNAERLAATVEECRNGNDASTSTSFDLRDLDLVRSRIAELDEASPIDLAIFNAGVGGATPRSSPTESAERAAEVAMVNFSSPVVAATELAARMVARRGGHIVFIGSIAESFPLPMAPTYAASKAGLALFAEALRLRVEPHGVGVTLVSLGFVDTAMSRQLKGPRPFLLTPDAAAAAIVRKVADRRRRAVIPLSLGLIRSAAVRLPASLSRAILTRL